MSLNILGSSPSPNPIMVPWATGRYYGFPYFGQFSTAGLSTSVIWGLPFYVPNKAGVTVTSIGLEVTGGGTAGKLIRFGIYTSNIVDGGKPGTLIVDAGTVAADAVSFNAATISQFLRQGWYWVCLVTNATPSPPTIRVATTLLSFVGGSLAYF